MTLPPRTISDGPRAGVSRCAGTHILAGIYVCSLTIHPSKARKVLAGWRKRCTKLLWPCRLARSQSPRVRTRGAD